MVLSVLLSFKLLHTFNQNSIETVHSAKVRFQLDEVESQIKDLIYIRSESKLAKEMAFSIPEIQVIEKQLLVLEQALLKLDEKLIRLDNVKKKWVQVRNNSLPDRIGLMHELDLLHRAINTSSMASIAEKEKIAVRHVSSLTMVRISIGVLILLTILLAMYSEKQAQYKRDELFKLIQESELKALEASRAKTMFLAIASHELRTPLNGMIGLAELLRRSSLPQKEASFIDSIYNSGKLLIKIINNILEFAKIESGKIELEIGEFSLKTLVDQIIAVLSANAHEKNIILNYTIDKNIPSKVEGDASRLSQIIYNLVGNAIKFTAIGSVTLRINVKSLDPENGLILNFLIEDTGIGLTPTQQEKMFLPYNIIQSKGTSGELGSGLGMAISMQLVKALGGEIKVTSELQKGSCFSFTAIFSKFSKEKVGNFEKHPLVDNDEHKNVSAIFDKENIPTILVVDDNPTNLLLAQEILDRLGAKSIGATNGAEAITEYSNGKVDLILMDCQMPVMDGYQASRELRKLGATIPIWAMTANTANEDQGKFHDAGMNGFINKPISINSLSIKLKKTLAPE
jgi:signal transduction histidine kinase/CheY-like chemotaxis protein